MKRADDPRLRLRVWIDGRLAAETWLDVSSPDVERVADAATDSHSALVQRADRDGRRWLVEVYDPARPEREAYARFGTDTAGMVDPRQMAGERR